MSTATEARTFEFGGFRLDVAQRQLFTSDGEHVDLPSRAFALLLYMVERPGELLDKSTLLKGVWPTTVVEESNLSQCIFALRRALGDTAAEHRFIVTVPGRGYQFVAPVHVVGALVDEVESANAPTARLPAMQTTPPAPGPLRSKRRRLLYLGGGAVAIIVLACGYLFWSRSATRDSPVAPAAPATIAHATIAVLPFADLSPARDMEYFADGIAEELMGSLAKVDGIQVIGRRSVFALKDNQDDAHTIGEKLKVEFLLEGSVRKEADRIRISTQLTRTKDGVSLWAENYDRKLDDVLDIQGSIARQVVAALAPLIDRPLESHTSSTIDASLTNNAEAYRAYLRGVYLYKQSTEADFRHARDEFLHAVELDPQFALAHAWLAGTYRGMAEVEDAAANRSLASAHIDRALKLDPRIADIWWVRRFFIEGDDAPLAVTINGLERAIAASPEDSLAMGHLSYMYILQGRRTEALNLLERAYTTDPLLVQNIANLSLWSYMFRGDRQRVLMSADELENLAPRDPSAKLMRADLAINEGRALEWDRWTARAIEVDPQDLVMHSNLSMDYANLGLPDAALHHARISARLNPKSARGLFTLSVIQLSWGDVDAARSAVQQAISQMPTDSQALLAQGNLQYWTNDCAGVIQSISLAMPAYARPMGTLDLLMNPGPPAPFVWCLRRLGDTERVAEFVRVFEAQYGPPSAPAVFDGWRARMAAAQGDRNALVTHLKALARTKSLAFAFIATEPMIQPYLHDPEVKALLDTLEARRAGWRKILPKSSMRVPIPGITVTDTQPSAR